MRHIPLPVRHERQRPWWPCPDLTLGQMLRHARRQQGRSLLDVAKDVYKRNGTQITPQYLAKIEADHRRPSRQVLVGLAQTLGLAEAPVLARAQRAEHLVRAYLTQYPEQEALVIAVFRQALTGHDPLEIALCAWASAQYQQKK